jgi:hypothetical protein
VRRVNSKPPRSLSFLTLKLVLNFTCTGIYPHLQRLPSISSGTGEVNPPPLAQLFLEANRMVLRQNKGTSMMRRMPPLEKVYYRSYIEREGPCFCGYTIVAAATANPGKHPGPDRYGPPEQ